VPQHRLLLVRHAEAASGPVDAERPLTERGQLQAAAIGAHLTSTGLEPDRVVVSPARRAVQTWQGAAAALPASAEPILDDRVLDNTVDALLAVVRETTEDVATLAVVGHQPSVGELLALLDDGNGAPDTGAGFRPGTVAVFALETGFAELTDGGATLTDFVVPAD